MTPKMDAKSASQGEPPEQLLGIFKAAALSVTHLYRSSIAAETRARVDGYNDCLDDLLLFLDKEGAGMSEHGLMKLRKWASDRREKRDSSPQTAESEDEADKTEPTSQPAPTSTTSTTSTDIQQPALTETSMTQSNEPPAEDSRPPEFIVPTQDNFTFQTDHQYPNIELLDLSDSRTMNHHSRSQRHRTGKTGPRSSGPLGRGAGAKRRMDFDDFFGGCLGGKDPFGNGGGKRSRHS